MNREQASLSVDTLELLKAKILKSAIEGKLVPQIEGEPEALQIGKAPEEVSFEIPKKWKWIRLDSLTDYIQRGKSPKYSEVKKIPVVSQKCNQWSGFEIDKARFIDPDTISKYSEERKLQDLDLLWNSTGTGTIGRVAVYESKLNPFDTAVADSHVTVVRVDKELMLPKFLYWFLRSPFVQQSIESLADGSTNQKELATRTIKNVLVPVPPLEEQKRIVEKVDCLFSKINVIQKSRDEVSQLSDLLEKQLLQSAIKGQLIPQLDDEAAVTQIGQSPEVVPFEIPKKWKWVRISDILTKLTDGEHKTPKYREEGVPFLSVKDISSGKIDFSQTKFISKEDFEIFKKRCNPQKGDILLSKVGTTGVPAIVEEDRDFGLFVSVALLKPDSSLIRSDFLYYQILSPHVQQQAKNNTRGVGNKNWVLKDIAKTLVVLPPLEEQKRIVEKLDKLMLEIHKLKQS